MAVRPATEHDLPEIAALIRELAAYERLEDEVAFAVPDLFESLFGPDPAAQVTMAHDADTVVGFALWFRTYSTFLGRPGIWLEDLFVRPEHRGKGHGLALLQHLRTLTDGRLEWAVLDWNTPSIRFYESLGARSVGGWTRYRWLP